MAKILLVDDSKTIRDEVKQVLTGYQILEASDGVEAVAVVARTPDLAMVVCDVNMPRMNGLDFVKTVKANGKNPKLPILMLTTEGRAGMVLEAQQMGATAWMMKPFKPEKLIATVKKLVK